MKSVIKRLFLFVLWVFFCAASAWGATLKVMNPSTNTPLDIELHATKRTERALAVRTADGAIYYADMLPVDKSFSGGMFARVGTQIYQIGPPAKFFITTVSSTSSFSFSVSAMGNFLVDWGDGAIQEIKRTDTVSKTYSHTYNGAGRRVITLRGRATGYSTDDSTAAISFLDNKSIASVDGSLGAIFMTIGTGGANGQQPRFRETFCGNANLTSIPAALFSGITGPAASSMFQGTFDSCSNLQSIPTGLFSGITGPAASSMFQDTFFGCSGLQSIPAGLFSGVTGPVAISMFQGTFFGCSGLQSIPAGIFSGVTGPMAKGTFNGTFQNCSGLQSLPSDLFSNVSGVPAEEMFDSTFSGCSRLQSLPTGLFSKVSGPAAVRMFRNTFWNCRSLTSIPASLFGNLYGTAQTGMFASTFMDCVKLSGASAKINGNYLYAIWPSATTSQVLKCYSGDTGLSDYNSIPAAWK